MIRIKKLLIILVSICFFIILFPLTSHAASQRTVGGLTIDQQNKVANFAKAFVTIGNQRGILRYSQGERMVGYNNTLGSEGAMYFDCASFAAFVYRQTCGIMLGGGNSWTYRVHARDTSESSMDSFAKDARARKNFYIAGYYTGDNTKLQPGDLIVYKDHVAVYIGQGQIAHASSNIGRTATNQVVIGNIYTENYTVQILRYYYNVPAEEFRDFSNYTWPDGSKPIWTEENLLSGYELNGLQAGTYGQTLYDATWIINKLSELLDWFIGIMTYIIRAIFVGWAGIIEGAINGIISWTTGEDASLTIEKLVNNEVAVLDVNFFNLKTAGGQTLEEDSVIYVIRESIATWYYVIRSIAIIGLLITLIYLGMRMALATIGEQKAKYKQLLVSWLTSFIITFGIHYLMIFILSINESLIELINISLAGGEESLYDTVRNGSYAIQASVGFPSLLMYIMLIYLLIKFLFTYFKRFLVVAILTFMAPIIGVTYSIDKIKDNKSQSLSNWLKEYTFNVIIQSVHALLYAIMMSMALNMSGESILGTILAAILIGFILKAEGIFKKIFGIKSGQLKDALKATGAVLAGGAVVKGFVKANAKAIGFVSKPVTKPVKKLASQTKMYKKMDMIEKIKENLDKGKTSIQMGGRTYELEHIVSNRDSFNMEDVAKELYSKYEEDNKEDKKYIKESMQQTLNTIKGTAQAVMAVPMIFVDSQSGIAMISKARGSLQKSINGKNKNEKYYAGKGKGIKNVMTAGLYKNAKNIQGRSQKQKNRLRDSERNAQYQIAVKLLEEKMQEEYARLASSETVDLEELNGVVQDASKTVSEEKIRQITYLINASLDNEIKFKIKSNRKNSSDTTSLDSQLEYLAAIENLETLKQEINNTAKNTNKNMAKIDESKFKKSVQSELIKMIAKEKGTRQKDITEAEINYKLKSMTKNEKKEIIKEAVVKSINMTEELKETAGNKKTNMKKEKVDKIIDGIDKSSKVKINKEEYKNNFEKLIKEEISNQQGLEFDNIGESDIDKYIGNLTNKELVQKIKEAGTMENSIKLAKSTEKPEYATLVKYIKNKNYYEAKKKGKS